MSNEPDRPATRMAEEIQDAPRVVADQAAALERPMAELVGVLDRRRPDVVVTCGRGSSAHAATFGKHLIERYLGIPVAAAAPSISSIYGQSLRLENQLFLAISQSGGSDDLIAMARSAKASGACTVALTNSIGSPLAAACDIVMPMGAGPELSVAATKTFIATASALLRLTAAWSREPALDSALLKLPGRMAAAAALEWNEALGMLGDADSLVTIGRGPTLGIAREAALKLKETCELHAEAFSGAEFMHGPVALASPQRPVLVFMPTDAAAKGIQQLAADLRGMGAPILIAGSPDGNLATLPPEQPEADAICQIQSFYALAERLSRHRGIDADRPRHLQKVTRTL